ncbi:hypothetical protein VNO77_39068 [Canavalia gladiata]|uniref:Uncharacterized protein n=1 Tax=Canavalia gladiata TaxID=3824 RepID=A0AAN9PWT1_CANGL
MLLPISTKRPFLEKILNPTFGVQSMNQNRKKRATTRSFLTLNRIREGRKTRKTSMKDYTPPKSNYTICLVFSENPHPLRGRFLKPKQFPPSSPFNSKISSFDYEHVGILYKHGALTNRVRRTNLKTLTLHVEKNAWCQEDVFIQGQAATDLGATSKISLANAGPRSALVYRPWTPYLLDQEKAKSNYHMSMHEIFTYTSCCMSGNMIRGYKHNGKVTTLESRHTGIEKVVVEEKFRVCLTRCATLSARHEPIVQNYMASMQLKRLCEWGC